MRFQLLRRGKPSYWWVQRTGTCSRRKMREAIGSCVGASEREPTVLYRRLSWIEVRLRGFTPRCGLKTHLQVAECTEATILERHGRSRD